MERVEMLASAKEVAHEFVDYCSALSDGRYTSLRKLGDEEAVRKLAVSILTEAAEAAEE